MEGLVIADTDVIIDFFCNRSTSAEIISALILKKRLAVTAITSYELYAGAQNQRQKSDISSLLSQCEVFSLRGVDAERAGTISFSLRRKGMLINSHDILIASICICRGRPLYTRNKSHFGRIEGLSLFEGGRV
ncbi:MAG: type II toxin-antitoxin system VapC family toxin [Vulcanimicrobiota bacterium]